MCFTVLPLFLFLAFRRTLSFRTSLTACVDAKGCPGRVRAAEIRVCLCAEASSSMSCMRLHMLSLYICVCD